MPHRFNHMELTFPPGGLDEATRRDIAAFYGEMFGWSGFDVELFEQRNFILTGDDGSQHFILLAEAKKYMQSPGYDHLGILCDTRDEVDELLERARRWRDKDDRVQIIDVKARSSEGPRGRYVLTSAYIGHLLPMMVELQHLHVDLA